MLPKNYRGIPAGYEDEEQEQDDFNLMDMSNLKIRIVPDITNRAGLNDTNFDVSLSFEMDIWFEAFQQKWNSYKKTPEIIQNLKTAYLKNDNPMLLALKLFANCPGCNNLKNKNLALFILETICELQKSQSHMATLCDDNMRMVAFNFVKTCGISTIYKSVMEAYELRKIKELLVPKVRELVKLQYYKDAAYWAILLEITANFDIFDIVFPLILQDKVFLAEEYLDVAQNERKYTVEFLDSLLDKKQSVYNHCDSIIMKYKYSDVKQSILSFRPMSKLVARLAKKYKIDSSVTPNLNYSKSRAYMHYLYRKYNEGGMSCDSWRELVRDAANTNLLKQELIENICSYGNFEEAFFWAKTFNIPQEHLPDNLLHELQLQQNLNDQQQPANVLNDNSDWPDTVDGNFDIAGASEYHHKSPSSRKEEFLQLSLEDDCIFLVDSRRKFHEMLFVLEAQTIIGFDSEWKPSACQEESVSLLQLAISDRVYLIDVMAPQLHVADLWKLLGRNIFNNIEILKIGFSLNQDMIMLHKSLPHLNLSLQISSSYLDLKDLWKRLQYMQTFAFPYKRVSYSGESLSALSEICLGKKLDKSNQFSNWANRPLRKDQMIYAALDAYCLIQIYQVIADTLSRIGLHIDHIVDEITTARNLNLKPRKATFGTANSFSSKPMRLEIPGIGATEIKFICDGMLAGLSKELRKLGIDCVDITNNDFESFIERAKNEKRYLLTRDSRYLQFSEYLPKNQCIEIPSDSNEKQIINVLQYFNIVVNESNLFSRCISCNWNEFIIARRHHMDKMKNTRVESNQMSSHDDLVQQQRSRPDIWTDPYEKTCVLKDITYDIVQTKKTSRGAFIKVDKLRSHILMAEEIFYICDNCGVCTWNGAHSFSSKIKEFIVVGSKSTSRSKK